MDEEYKVIPVGRAKDLRGQKFGRLTVLDRVEKPVDLLGRKSYWLCNCECGAKSVVASQSLTGGHTKSCGHLDAEGSQFGTLVKLLDQKLSRANTSGFKGVHWHKINRIWIANIKYQRKVIYLGSFDHLQDAIDARKEAENYYFKPVLEHFEDRRYDNE